MVRARSLSSLWIELRHYAATPTRRKACHLNVLCFKICHSILLNITIFNMKIDCYGYNTNAIYPG